MNLYPALQARTSVKPRWMQWSLNGEPLACLEISSVPGVMLQPVKIMPFKMDGGNCSGPPRKLQRRVGKLGLQVM